MWEWLLFGSIIIILIVIVIAVIIYYLRRNSGGSTGATGGNTGINGALIFNGNTVTIQENLTGLFLTSIPAANGQINLLGGGSTGTIFTVGVDPSLPEVFTLQSGGNYLNLFQAQVYEVEFTTVSPGLGFSILGGAITTNVSGQVTFMSIQTTENNVVELALAPTPGQSFTVIQA